jgi:hypothetical protein
VLEPEDQSEQCRLAAAVWPRDREELASFHPEIDVPEHGRSVLVRERDVLEPDG